MQIDMMRPSIKSHKRLMRKTHHLPKFGNYGKYWDFKIYPKKIIDYVEMKHKDRFVAVIVGVIHCGALLAPFTYSLNNLNLFLLFYLISGLGVTLSYHRQLTHKSFVTSKLLEYFFAMCGVLAIEGHPIEWVSAHRHHHQQCDKDLDPHSPMDGLYWSHIGWLFDVNATPILKDSSNAKDLKSQPFYRFLKKHYIFQIFLQLLFFNIFFGFGGMIWGFFLRVVFVWHVTWAVNSLSHVWGFQSYKTDDISMNNWFVALLGFGEGWHNNHHAFEESAAHGLKWWQFDPTWYIIWILKKVGLAWNVKIPSERRLKSKEIVFKNCNSIT